MFYFFKTIKEGNQVRIRPLENQTTPNQQTINPDLNCQGSMEVRKAYPLGTIFASDICELRSAAGQMPFYATGDKLYVIESSQSIRLEDIAPEEAQEQWTRYKLDNQFNSESAAPKTRSQGPKKLLDKIMANPNYATPTIDKDGFYIQPDKWLDTVMDLIDGENILLKGPAGTGKTTLATLLGSVFGVPVYIYDMATMFDAVAQMQGVHRIEKGESVFDQARFAKQIQTKCIIVLDELNRAAKDAATSLMSILDWRKTMFSELADSKGQREIKVHPECRFIATINEGPEYLTNPLDKALRDRFLERTLDYLPEVEEIKLLMKKYKILNSDAANIVSVATKIRKKYVSADLSNTVTTRETMRCARYVENGRTAKYALETIFLELFEGTDIEGERAVVKNMILAR